MPRDFDPVGSALGRFGYTGTTASLEIPAVFDLLLRSPVNAGSPFTMSLVKTPLTLLSIS